MWSVEENTDHGVLFYWEHLQGRSCDYYKLIVHLLVGKCNDAFTFFS